MAMVATNLTGKNLDPVTMARLSEVGGYSNEYGTSPDYFNAAATTLGIPSSEVTPTPETLEASLSSGNSIILQGRRSGSYNSPFTSEGHYVTATGTKNGNVIINDPRGKEYSGEYAMSDVLGDATGMWSFGDGRMGGFGNGKIRNKLMRKLKGGKAGNWLDIVAATKRAFAESKPGYYTSNGNKWINLTVNGKSLKVRTDCTGFVGACVYFYSGELKSQPASGAYVQSGGTVEQALKRAGFTRLAWPGWDGVKAGDILSVNGHCEISAEDGTKRVYNAGSPSSCNNPGVTNSGHASYTCIYRPGYAGSVTGGVSSSSDGASSDSNSSGFSSISELLGGLASAAAKPFLEAFGLNTGDSSSSSSESTDSGSYISATNVQGSSTAERMWNYFRGLGYSKAATAAIMGNAMQESSLNPASGKDESAVAHGLFQWETNRRFPYLKKHAESKGVPWYTVDPQIEFLHSELQNPSITYWNKTATYGPNIGHGAAGKTNFEVAGTVPTTYDEWKKSTDVDKATRQFEAAMERASWPRIEKRVGYAKGFYEKYGDTETTNESSKTNLSKPVNPIRRKDGSNNKLESSKGGSMSGHPLRPSGGRGSFTTTADYSLSSGNYKPTASSMGNIGDASISQLINIALEYLSVIADNTGTTNDELETLNKKEFTQTTNKTTMNNVVDNSKKSYNNKPTQNDADRSQYSMAKRLAAGILT